MNTVKLKFKSVSILALLAALSGCSLEIDSENDTGTSLPVETNNKPAHIGARPLFLVDQMSDGELKNKLAQCKDNHFYKTDWSIGHRGASMMFPEHTKEAYQAAIDSGAGIVECDVTFTKDKQLVCRHAQCDLHTTTNILAVPELAAKCSTPFTPADPQNGVNASAQCCTSDISLAEFKTLCGKMDGANNQATTAEAYMDGTAKWRTDLHSTCATLMTHKESIEMFKQAGVKMTPELKAPAVTMPYDGMSQQDYAQKMIDEYIEAGVSPEQVFAQSFNLADVEYWVNSASDFGKQAVYLDDRYDTQDGFNPQNTDSFSPSMAELKSRGVEIIAPPLWVLVTVDADNKIIPSEYAKAANAAGLKIITWSLERSGKLSEGADWYYQSIAPAIQNEGVVYQLLDVLAKDIGVIGVFSDWPATVTYYANCMEM
ncbi:glycerophosphodiester phosphodiesterase family protein [Catenovulum sp. 2E275]|uniref:glycerophosphodiester phosphodiesterase family protein n=1 Tax=Catenovulum sp. 2E275 TaxID=2980497 RepID=UPI0021CF3BDC|nr:glycerophosphodiester phosphodiesterase family protein [Catenovulum sp. 2E275]MCU4676620.1 glycerophosphodiester phosphodiesterase family protein [Catenovulum sp. 2E275]